MRTVYGKAAASAVSATVRPDGVGGFTAIASTADVDRDGERIAPGCFEPLPATIPVHLDHTMRAADVIARGRPYYRGEMLMIDATFAGDAASQGIRAKVADGTLDSMSIVFRGLEWRDVDGVRTCVRGELLAADIVSVPSNRGARILSSRAFSGGDVTPRQATADALLALAEAEVAEAKSLVATLAPRGRGPSRLRVAAELKDLLNPSGPASSEVRRFLRSL